MKKKTETEFFDPYKYACWITGNGVGKYYNREIPPKNKVLDYLERNVPGRRPKRVRKKK
jgi:hypothetical protein